LTANREIANRETAANIRNHCGTCTGDSCPLATPDQQQVLHGWRLALASLVFFLLPLTCAIAGAVCFHNVAHLQLVGTLAGLVIGLAAGAVIARVFTGRETVA
jgi:hypothetical protein